MAYTDWRIHYESYGELVTPCYNCGSPTINRFVQKKKYGFVVTACDLLCAERVVWKITRHDQGIKTGYESTIADIKRRMEKAGPSEESPAQR